MSKNVVSFKEIDDEEYLANKKQIDCISKVLVEQADVPKKLVDWLIDAVKKNTIKECKK